ncbi:GNAT family N-acetyltransferase [Subtercola sp. Z020]|uniref:GNAT family N-acetyltransferase n=1 Tax=Subtercola sp. Z020 TaxID=2080582 RepID=UPI000CE8B95A|nr:GNAT family N-acetyltransferase [Subtercola sp. Z020]PPF79887.1 GNAT family N-acetyltransferase [Subtercola sp. Z020]
MTVTVHPFPVDDLPSWIDEHTRAYQAERQANGEAPEVAERRARDSAAENFPNGSPRESHRLVQVRADGVPVGTLWIGPLVDERPHEWWVWSIDIDEAHRGQGYGREAMALAEVIARENGATRIGLNVFGDNARAQNLYRSLEYRVTSLQMSKEL